MAIYFENEMTTAEQDIDLDNPPTLEWPSFRADKDNLKWAMEKLGAHCIHSGRSGNQTRNWITVRLPEKADIWKATDEDLLKTTELFKQAEELINETQKANFLNAFMESSKDGGTTGVVSIGGHSDNPDSSYHEQFGWLKSIGVIRIGGKDSSRDLDHTSKQLLLDTRKITRGQSLAIIIPDDFKGIVIGKGGVRIKKLQDELGVRIKIK